MKKLLVTLLAFLYLTGSCDAIVYVHYCMGKRVGFSFLPGKSSHCHRCGMKKSGKGMGCCKDEQKIIRSEKNQKQTDLSYLSNQQNKLITGFVAYYAYTAKTVQSSFHIHSSSHGPPGIHRVPVYLMNRFLLI